MSVLAAQEQTLKISDLFRKHFETLDYKKLSVPYPQGNGGMGAGHVTYQGMSLQNSRELAMVNDQVYRREEIENLKKWLTLTDWTKPATRYLVHGPHLSGKTIGANTLVQFARQRNWFVIFSNSLHKWSQRTHPTEVIVPRTDIRTEAFVTSKSKKVFKTRYEPLMEEGNYRRLVSDAVTYDQNDPAGHWLQTLKKLNGAHLKKMKSTRPFQLSMDRNEDIPAGVPLTTLLEEGYQRYQLRCDTMAFLIREIKAQAPQLAEQGTPVLVVTDQANLMTQGCYVSIIRSPEQIPTTDWGVGTGNTGGNSWRKLVAYEDWVTDSRRLNGLRYLHDLHQSDWAGAAVVGFTTNNQMPRKKWNMKLGKHNDRNVIEHENDLMEMLGDQGFAGLWHPFVPIELKNMDDKQKALITQWLWAKKVIYGRSESYMAQQTIETMSDDVMGRFIRNQIASY